MSERLFAHSIFAIAPQFQGGCMSSNTVGEELKSALLELEKTLEEESNLSAEHYSKRQAAHTRFFNSLKIWVSEIERQNPFVSYSTMGIAVKDASNRCETSLPIMTTKTTLWFGGNSSSTYLQFVPESFQEIRLDWVS